MRYIPDGEQLWEYKGTLQVPRVTDAQERPTFLFVSRQHLTLPTR